MSRFFVIISLSISLGASLGVLTSAAQAQEPSHDACARDVSRFCRSLMGDGDQAVLACLKEHRPKLAKACEKVLTEHGQ